MGYPRKQTEEEGGLGVFGEKKKKERERKGNVFNVFFFLFFFWFRKLRGYLSFLGKVGMNMNQSEVVSYYEAFVGKISEMANVNMG